MKKFEEEFDKNVDVFHAIGYHNGICCSVEEAKTFGHGWVSPEDHQAEITKLKNEINWLHNLLDGRNEEVLQTVKQLNEAIPEIPESLAKIIEAHDLSVLGDWEKVVNLLSEDALTWLSQTDNVSAVLGKAATLCNLKIKGYTVAKEKKYLLKHKSLVIYGDEDEETDADELYLNAEGNFTIYPYDAKIFTQSEIDSMETGSYEKIEVSK